MKIKIFDIVWDVETDAFGESPTPEDLGLPTEYVTEVPDDFDPEEQCADLLSDKFGFCVINLSYELPNLSALFWEHVEPSLDGYSKAIDFLLRQIPQNKMPAVVKEWRGDDTFPPN